MNASGDAAEQVVRMTLDGVQVAAKITGKGAEHLAQLLILALKDTNKRTKGRASLSTMLKSQKPIKVFEIEDKDLRKFCQEAKKYGVMYHILKDHDDRNNRCDIMVRAEDASKVNRIFERFNLGANNQATIKQSLEKAQGPFEVSPESDVGDIERFVKELMKNSDKTARVNPDNPFAVRTEKSRQSEVISANSTNTVLKTSNTTDRPSVRMQLAEIKQEQDKQIQMKNKGQITQNKSKSKKKRSKSNVR